MTDRIIAIEIDDGGRVPSAPDIEQERRVAILDLLEDNRFRLVPRDGGAAQGPWRLSLGLRDRRLVLAIHGAEGQPAGEIHLSLGPFRQVVKDYFRICESYYDAIRRLPPSQIETIDMARRGIHNEGARILQERLEGKVEMDQDTARRLFTLVCVLQWGE